MGKGAGGAASNVRETGASTSEIAMFERSKSLAAYRLRNNYYKNFGKVFISLIIVCYCTYRSLNLLSLTLI
jgi:hypothetical protein